jgi:uncharacterized protein (TIGR04255 family)
VQFDRLPGFKNAHLGAFWKTLNGDEWPAVADVPPLPAQFERFTEAARWAKGLKLQLTQDPACRLQIRNRDNDRMIQLQNGRLHFNWMGKTGVPYPRYAKVRDEFEWAMQRFVEFAAQEQVGEFRPNQWEVTYVNHIQKGTVWNVPEDWRFFRLLGAIPTIQNLVQAEDFAGEWHFQIPQERGRLHVLWQIASKSALEQQDEELVRLTLTGRGPLKEGENAFQQILEGLDLGRETIVRSFKTFMSDEANKHWGLKHAGD